MTTLSPVTLPRVEAVLQQLGLNFTTGTQLPGTSVSFDEDTIMTGFTNVMMFIDIHDGVLRCRASWRGLPTNEDSPRCLAAVNEWNLTQITPRLSMAKDSDDNIVMHIFRRWAISAGATDEQLDHILRGVLGASVSCADWLDTQFPAIADQWKDEPR